MPTVLLKAFCFVVLLAACSSPRNSSQSSTETAPVAEAASQPVLPPNAKPRSLMELPQTEQGGFVLRPGFYEAEFKTYCLQPGTPDPRQGDAYLQGPVTGYRKDIIQSVLLNSKDARHIDQKNIQLLLWSVVSGSSFNSLSYSVQQDAAQLLTPKQVFELKGGVLGMLKEVSYASGILNANSDIKRLFETGLQSYEAYERIAVRTEPSRVVKKGVKWDQWYTGEEGYYVRYLPESYKKVRIQVYVPETLLDSSHKLQNEYIVFDPTGQQAIPAFTNAQRLGIGAPVLDILREVIKVNRQPLPPKKIPEKPNDPKTAM
jgi:hypothetical protein